jgi:hypothetical protein
MKVSSIIGAACAAVFFVATQPASAGGPSWTTVVNNGQVMPQSTKLFNAYNQPSINNRGLVVFRARSKGPQQPMRGIYAVDLLDPTHAVSVIASVANEVPQPNNIQYPPGSGVLAKFKEFPSFPRIDAASDMAATRGQSQPVWNYLLPDGTETSVGTSGVFATIGGTLLAGVNLLGNVADPKSGELVFPWWQVPGAAPGTRFDQFPGAASPSDGQFVAFKGNWTDTIALIGRTGVYYRSLTADGGESPVIRIADSQMVIPGQESKVPLLFGSTAPPSASDGRVVFVGLDNEEAPTMGGIYLARIAPDSVLQTLVEIGDRVPGEDDDDDDDQSGNNGANRFNRIGEALSFDGRWVTFWGAWGSEVRKLLLTCPTDGNEDVIQYCNEQYPDGFATTAPVHQGIFAVDTESGTVVALAKTGVVYDDFLFWNFSGSPGTGGDEGGDQEPPRWRSTSFAAIEGGPGCAFRAAFKVHLGTEDAVMVCDGRDPDDAWTLVATGMPGTAIDPLAPAGSAVSAVGIERDGMRGGRIAIVASMLDAVTGEAWAGVYARSLPPASVCAGDIDCSGEVDARDLTILASAWGTCGACAADLDGDGVVDGRDLTMLLSGWGECE